MAVGRRSRQCSESQFCTTPDRTDSNFQVPLTSASFGAEYSPAKTDAGDEQGDASVTGDGFHFDGTGNGETRLCNSLISLPTFIRHGDKIPHEVLMTITNNPRLYSIVLDNYPALFEHIIVNETPADETEAHTQLLNANTAVAPTALSSAANCKDPSGSPLAGPFLFCPEMQRRSSQPPSTHWNTAYLKGLRVKKRSLTYRGAMLNLPRYRLRASSCPDIYRNSITTIAREKEGVSVHNSNSVFIISGMFRKSSIKYGIELAYEINRAH